jgi:hypothetical protein
MMNQSSDLFLHEEVMLLALKDKKGTVESGAHYTHAVAGAVIAELLMNERIRIDEQSKRKKLVVVESTTPLGDPLVDECLAKINEAKKPKKIQEWVMKFAGIKKLKHRVAEKLAHRGILKVDQDQVLLIFTRTIYPEVDPRPENEIIERMRRAIFTEIGDVDPRTAVLIALAKAADLLKYSFDKKKLKERKARIEAIANGDLVGQATKEAIQAMQAAVMVAVIIPATVAATTHH